MEISTNFREISNNLIIIALFSLRVYINIYNDKSIYKNILYIYKYIY